MSRAEKVGSAWVALKKVVSNRESEMAAQEGITEQAVTKYRRKNNANQFNKNRGPENKLRSL